MSKFAMTFRRFMKDESGATMVEYGVLVALIAVVAVAAVRTLGTTVSGSFTNASTAIAP
jgi:pilus assembly protein Flp/PilA